MQSGSEDLVLQTKCKVLLFSALQRVLRFAGSLSSCVQQALVAATVPNVAAATVPTVAAATVPTVAAATVPTVAAAAVPTVAAATVAAATVSTFTAAAVSTVAAATVSAVAAAIVSAAVPAAIVSAIATASSGCGTEDSGKVGRNRVVGAGDASRHISIAGGCSKSDQGTKQCVLGHGLAAIGQGDSLKIDLDFGDIDLHMYSLHLGQFVDLAILNCVRTCQLASDYRCGGATLRSMIHATIEDNPPSDFFSH
jgi:hypothetical protein